MKVIFKDNVKPYKKDDVVNVSDGYAINYLFPRKLAIPVTVSALKELEDRKAEQAERDKEKIETNESVAKVIESKTLEFKMKSSNKGNMIGSVAHKDIAARLNEIVPKSTGVEIKAGMITPKKFEEFGEHTVEVKLFKVIAKVKVNIEEE